MSGGAARFRLALLVLVAAVLFGSATWAHTRSESNAVWEIDGQNVDLVMTVPQLEAQRLAPKGGLVSDAMLIGYLTPKVYPLSAGRRCALLPPVDVLGGTPGFRKLDFTFRCPSSQDISVHSGAFFDLVPSHVNFAQVQDATTGEFTEQLITKANQTVQVTGGEGASLQRAGFLDFIKMGVMHIFTGVDHMSFLLGLVLISRRLRDLVFVVTGFTIGHSLTLALAVTGVIRPHPEFIDALVALTIALIGAENIAVATRRPALVAGGFVALLAAMFALRLLGIGELPSLLILGAALFSGGYLMVSGQLPDAGRLRMVITLVFGLVHGFGFAADLLKMQIPPLRMAELLVGFNLGVEIGQLTLVVSVSLLVLALSKVRLTAPRPLVVDVAASGLMGLGVYWFVTRSF